jgi:DMSO/TMAO reductase YedYZ molybdopterin-dependent catalytic subunit
MGNGNHSHIGEKGVKKSTATALVFFAVLIAAVIPLYCYTRPDPTQPADTLQVKGAVNNPANLTLAEISSFPSITREVTLTSSGHQSDNGNYTYTGVTLKEILTQTQISSNATKVYIQASDGYGTTLTNSETENDNVFIAYLKDGSPLTLLSDGGEGPFRLIISNDKYAQRWVRGVVTITVS